MIVGAFNGQACYIIEKFSWGFGHLDFLGHG